MPRLPVKKLRKQLKLLLLLALLTSAAWFTYLHISLVRQGRALRLPFAYGKGNGGGGVPGSPRSGASGGFGGPQGLVGLPRHSGVPEHLGFGGPHGAPGLPPALCSQSTWGSGVPEGFGGPPATLGTRSSPPLQRCPSVPHHSRGFGASGTPPWAPRPGVGPSGGGDTQEGPQTGRDIHCPPSSRSVLIFSPAALAEMTKRPFIAACPAGRDNLFSPIPS